MIVAVSTVKDTLANIERFVAGNLRGGIDHLVVVLDAPDAPGQDEVAAWLDEHVHVTTILADGEWWRGKRPEALNVRQRINANLVKAALTTTPWAEWLFHIDADEIAWIDRGVLAKAPSERRAARLLPLEAVAQRRWDGDPTWFKRLLTPEELADLHARGLVAEPSNGHYFHGHPFGKVGVRPALDIWLTLHTAVDDRGETIKPFTRPRLRMLHYESYSGDDFVRKWTSLIGSGALASFRASRERTALEIRDALGLPGAEARGRLMEIFTATTEDDLPLLRELGLLVEVDPRTWTHEPEPLSAGEAERLDALLARLRAAPKQQFHPGEPAARVAKTLARATAPATAGRSWLRRF